MNILIVGGAGYIGSHMVQYLREQTTHTVTVLDNLAKGHAAAVQGTELVVGDFGDQALVAALCRERGITALIHFGADSLVGESVQHPAKYYENNVVKGKRLIDAVCDAGVRQVIFSSTAATYGEPARVPIQEGDPTIPTNPYGRTKLAFEGLLESYREAYGLQYTCLRYFNAAGAHVSGTIGEDHSPESHLIPLVLQVALGTRAHIAIYGDDYATPDGTCVRDYIHVSDLALAHLLALERLVAGGPSAVFNLGNGQGFSVKEVIDVCRQVTGHPIPAVLAPRRPGDPAVLVASAARAQVHLGWQPRSPDLQTIVESAWRWHQSHPAGYAAQVE
jgi:UDP-glucose 4-epimerase